MRRLKIISLFTFMLIPAMEAEAQTDLRNVEEEIRGEYNPELNDPVRLDNQPVIADTVRSKIGVEYSLIDVAVPVKYQIDTITAAVIKKEPVKRIYRNYLNAGFGLYTTPVLEFRHGSGRTDEGRYSLLLSHRSSSGDLPDAGFSAFSKNKVDLAGERFFPRHNLYGRFNYDRDVLHYYGYDPRVHPFVKDSIRQRYNRFDVETDLKTSQPDSTWDYRAALSYHYTGSAEQLFENNFRLRGNLFRYMDREMFGGNLALDYYRNTTPFDTINYGLIKVNPEVKTRGKKWFVRAGMNIVFEMETDSVSKAHFYPDAEVQFNVVDNILIPYAGISGDMEKNSLRTLTDENPFLGNLFALRNTNRKYNAFAGIRGALSSRISFNVRASYGEYRDLPLFVSLPATAQNYFTVVYDTAKIVNVHGEAGYMWNERLHVNGSVDYYRYDMSSQDFAWNRPAVKAAISARYSLFGKIVTTADVYYIGERTARSNFSEGSPGITGVFPVELKEVTDINLGIEYRYTNRLSGYLRFNNILASRYYPWMQYPSQRFMLLGGVALSF